MSTQTDTDGGRSYWERHALHYARSLGPLSRPVPRLLELVGESTHGMERVLEVAAGTGLVTPALSENAATVISTDYASAMVVQLKNNMEQLGLTNVDCQQANLYNLTFIPGTFDAVVAANVLHLVPNLESAIQCLRRMLRPGGVLIVPTFCHDETWVSWVLSRILAVTGFPSHRRFTAQQLKEAVMGQGAQITKEELLPGLIPIGYITAVFQD